MVEQKPDSEPRARRASLLKATESIKKVAAPKKKRRDDEYEVEDIVSHFVVDGVPIYSVTWVGYPGEVSEMTEDELSNCSELLKAYKEKVKESGDTIPISTTQSNSNHLLEVKESEPLSNGYKQGQSCSTSTPSMQQENNSKVVAAPPDAKKKRKRNVMRDNEEVNVNTNNVVPTKRSRKVKRVISADSELAFTNGCVVDAYKGFSVKYEEPVVLVSYKQPLPSGFENKQDEIVPIRLIAKADPQGLITHLVELLSGGRGNVTI